MVSPDRAERYSRDQRRVAALAQRELRRAWVRLDLTDPVAAKAALVELLPSLVASYGPIAATVAADFYDELRATSDVPTTRYRARPTTSVNVEQVAKSAEWAIQPLFAGDPAGALERAEGSLQRHVEQSGRDTILDNTERDPSRPGWARMPIGDTCRWCRMLASRGAAYTSREKALYRDDGGRYHDECDCQPVLAWSDDDLPYDPAPLLDEYLADRSSGATVTPSTSPQAAPRLGFDTLTADQLRNQRRITEGLPDSPWRTAQLQRVNERLREIEAIESASQAAIAVLDVDDVVRAVPASPRLFERNRPPTYEDLLERGDVADDVTLNAEEAAAATYLRSRGIEVRTVRPSPTAGKSPDFAVRRPGGDWSTMELKTPTAGTQRAFVRNVRTARQQSRRVMVTTTMDDLDAARRYVADAVRQHGGDLDELILVMADGTAVGWTRG